jgi:hypothetical protein
VGPLWQGRFKSWFVYDELYLKALVKYIEYNPIKAGISKKIGEYKWAMSSNNFEFFSQRVQSTRASATLNTTLTQIKVKNYHEKYQRCLYWPA